MPLQDKLVDIEQLDRLGLVSSEIQKSAHNAVDLQPSLNSMMKCPLPPVSVSPDSLRQYYRGGQLPQTRVLSPSQPVVNGTPGTSSSNNGSSNSSTTITTTLSVKQTAITTSNLPPNSVFTGILALGKAFQLVQVSSSASARIELYGTNNALQLDSYRGLDVPPPFGSVQGLILDVALDTAPLTFPLEGVMGSNYDNPQKDFAYIAVTNIGAALTPIIVTISYIALVA
jgi:hypothetical protein